MKRVHVGIVILFAGVFFPSYLYILFMAASIPFLKD